MKIKRSTLVLWKRRLVLFFGISLLFSLLYIYLRTPLFTITSYELIGVPEMYKESIISHLNTLTTKKLYGIIPGNRIFSYHRHESKEVIVSILPNTQKISISPIGLHTLRISVLVYEPFFKIDDTHAITKDGIIYNEFKDITHLPTISFSSTTKKISKHNELATTTILEIDTHLLKDIQILSTRIPTILFTVSRIYIDEYGDISLYDERGISKVIFSQTFDVEKVWSNLVSAVDTDPLKSKLIHEKNKLEYLDTRFGNKVFFKFTKEDKTDIIQNHATTTETRTNLH